MPARTTRRSASTPRPEKLEENVQGDVPQLHFEAGEPLVSKVAKIMGAVGYVPKSGWNDHFRYKYVQEADLVGAIRPLLSAAGIIIIPNVISTELDMGVVEERTGRANLCRVNVEYTVTDGADSFSFTIPGYGVDRSDKSVYKALTGSMKYALMKLFQVETGDDPEREAAPSPTVTIEESDASARKGGHADKATFYQLQRISATMREKKMSRDDLVEIITGVLGVELVLPEEDDLAQKAIRDFLQGLSSEDAGILVKDVEAWTDDERTDLAPEALAEGGPEAGY